MKKKKKTLNNLEILKKVRGQIKNKGTIRHKDKRIAKLRKIEKREEDY